MINPKNLNWVHRRRKRDEECPLRREFTSWNDWGKTEEAPYEWKLMLKRDWGSGKKRVGGQKKTKASWKGEPTNILKRKHRLKSLRRENKNFARVGWILDYRPRFKEEEGWAGGKENNWGLNLAKMKRPESTWREMHRMKRAENQRSENQLREPKEKFEWEEE